MNVQFRSTFKCPECGFVKEEVMPTDSCQYFYQCVQCKQIIRPKPGDCCVFCSFGSVKCPIKQQEELSDDLTGGKNDARTS